MARRAVIALRTGALFFQTRMYRRSGPFIGRLPGTSWSRNSQPPLQLTLRLPRYNSTLKATSFARPPVFHLDHATVYPFGVSQEPLFRNLSWTVGDADCWAIMAPQSASSSSTKSNLVQVVQTHARVSPLGSATYPILKTLPLLHRSQAEGGPREPDISDIIHFVSFKTRLSQTGEFDDYTARYGSIRDEDRLTVRQHLEQSLPSHVQLEGAEQENDLISETARLLKIDQLLDLPLITLSNGQTRRARILRALLHKPELLILEEPFTGLDVDSRAMLVDLLESLHKARAPRIMLVLRPQDHPLPSLVTHLGLVGHKSGDVCLGPKEEILDSPAGQALQAEGLRLAEEQANRTEKRRQRREEVIQRSSSNEAPAPPLVQLRAVDITYGTREQPRKVLEAIDWDIRPGERWLLAGHNGSGKSTLLSVILGDHPKSFAQDVSLFGRARVEQATATIQDNIGHVSPEISNAFPRRHGPQALTAEEAILTGFDSIFSYRPSTEPQRAALSVLLESFDLPELLTTDFMSTPFVALPPASQQLVLLLRALVKPHARLLVLDEPFAGMPGDLVEHCKRFIDERLDKDKAVVVVSHWDEEVPASVDRVLRLEDGRVIEKI